MTQRFAAPWGLPLKLVTGVFLLVWLLTLARQGALAAAALLVLAVLATLYGVRGYSVGEGRLTVHRLGWVTSFELAGLERVTVLEGGIPRSLRMSGLGGLFAFVGWYWQPELGWYRAYATDGSRAVLLDLDGQRILVTPDSPRRFAAAVQLESRRQDP